MAKLASTGTVNPTSSSMQPKRRRRQSRRTLHAGAIGAGGQENIKTGNENSPHYVLEHVQQGGQQIVKDDRAGLPNPTLVVPAPTHIIPETTREQQQQLRRELCADHHCFDPEEKNVFSPPVPPPTLAPTTLSQRAQDDDENCVSDGAGNYGPTAPSSSFRTVEYYYQLETTAALADVALLNFEVLQDVEKAISDRLVKRFFKETCTTAPVIDVSSPNNNQNMNDMIDGLTLGAATTPIPSPSSATPAPTPLAISNIQVTHHESSANPNDVDSVLVMGAATTPPSSWSPSVPAASPGEISNIQVTHHESSTTTNVLSLGAATTPPSASSASGTGDITNIQVTTTSTDLNEGLSLGAATTPPSSSSASGTGGISNIQVTTTTNLNEGLTLGAATTPPFSSSASGTGGISNIQVTTTANPPPPPSSAPTSSNPWGITNIQVAVSNPFKDEQAPVDGMAAKGGGLRRLQNGEYQQPVVGLTAAPLDQVLDGSAGEACPFPTTDGPCFVIWGGVTFFGGDLPDGLSTDSDASSGLSWIDQIVHEELKIGMNSGSLENAVRTEQPDVVAIRYIPAGTELPNSNGNNPGEVDAIGGGRSTGLSWVLMGVGFLLLAVVFCYMYITRRQQKREEEEERNAFVAGGFPVTVTSANLGRDALYRNDNNFPETASSQYSASPARVTRSGVSYGYATDDEGFPLHVFQDDNNNSPQQLPQGVSTSWRDQILREDKGSLDPNRPFVRPVLNDEGHSYYRSPEYGSGSYESSSFASSPRSRVSPSKLTVAFEKRDVI